MVKKALYKVINVFRKRRIRGIVLWKPVNCHISRNANIQIEKKFPCNCLWNVENKNRLGSLSVKDNAELYIGDVSVYSGSTLSVTGKFSMKSGYINNDCTIFCRNEITIGEEVVIAPEVIIRDSDQHQLIAADGNAKPLSSPIHIGNHVWIGTRSIILKGVTIGKYAIIGANSDVTKDIPDYAMAVGVPAKVIKFLDPQKFSKKKKDLRRIYAD